MEIIKDRDLIWYTDDYDVILIGTSVYNMLTQGFQSKMAMKYPEIVEADRQTPYGDMRKLGKRITIDGTPTISLMYICRYPSSIRDYLSYESLERCLETANQEFKGKRVATTVLGTSRFDGNGDKDRCLDIIEKAAKDMDLTVFDYEQLRKRDEIKKIYQEFNKFGAIGDWDTFWRLVARKDEIIANSYLRH